MYTQATAKQQKTPNQTDSLTAAENLADYLLKEAAELAKIYTQQLNICTTYFNPEKNKLTPQEFQDHLDQLYQAHNAVFTMICGLMSDTGLKTPTINAANVPNSSFERPMKIINQKHQETQRSYQSLRQSSTSKSQEQKELIKHSSISMLNSVDILTESIKKMVLPQIQNELTKLRLPRNSTEQKQFKPQNWLENKIIKQKPTSFLRQAFVEVNPSWWQRQVRRVCGLFIKGKSEESAARVQRYFQAQTQQQTQFEQTQDKIKKLQTLNQNIPNLKKLLSEHRSNASTVSLCIESPNPRFLQQSSENSSQQIKRLSAEFNHALSTSPIHTKALTRRNSTGALTDNVVPSDLPIISPSHGSLQYA